MEGIIANAQDAKRAWLEAALAEGVEIAEPSRETVPADCSGQLILLSD